MTDERPQLSVSQAAALMTRVELDESERLCRDALAVGRESPEGLGLLAAIANARKDFAQAVELAERAIALAGRIAWIHVEKAIALQALGQYAAAAVAARGAVDIDPDVPGGYPLLSQALMPGESYCDILGRFHALLAPRSYFEIGVARGATIALVGPSCVAVGVDPKPDIQGALAVTTRIFPLESDVYFASRDVRADLDADCVDLAFIDGLHVFQQALRDFINVERFAGSGSVVLLHDCIPIDAVTASAERRTQFWTGDVWKVIAALRKWRPDLDIQSVATSPSGLGVICRLDPESRVLRDNYDAIVAEFLDQAAPVTPSDRLDRLSVVDNDWAQIAARVTRSTGRGRS
jgi:tetratricopeptide (TPR) repeat protein